MEEYSNENNSSKGVTVELLEQYSPLFEINKHLRYYIITGGRGSGKSFHIAIYLLNLTYLPNEVILYSRFTLTSAEISIIPEFVEKLELFNCTKDFYITKKEIVNIHTGSKIVFRGLKTSSGNQTANLKSIQGLTTWFLDEAEELVDEKLFDKINRSIRAKGVHNKVILALNSNYTSHFIYNKFFKIERDDTAFIHTTYLDNIHNLSDSFLADAEFEKLNRPKVYAHQFLGEWIDESEESLFEKRYFKYFTHLPKLKHIAISLDVAVTSNSSSDETGIIVLGKGFDSNYYILNDSTMKGKPTDWSTIVSMLIKKYKVKEVYAESNQGGDLIEAVLDISEVKYTKIHATESKKKRAEPVSLLYAKGKVLHHESLKDSALELQLLTFSNFKKSPNNVDALVHGIRSLNDKSSKSGHRVKTM